MRQSHTAELFLNTIRRKLASVVGFGRINHHTGKNLAQTSWGDGSEGDDQKDRTRIYQHFGLKTKAPKGTKCLGICAGSRDNMVIISTDNDVPMELKEGESLLYSRNEEKVSCHIHLKSDGTVILDSDSTRIKSNKIEIINSNGDELLSLIFGCLESIASSKIATPNGPQPLVPYSTNFSLLSNKIKSFIASKRPLEKKEAKE